MGDKKIKLLCYADDAVLFAETEDDLQTLLIAFHTTAQIYNIEISKTKTKNMVTAKEPTQCKLVLNAPIEQVIEFEYLGCRISSNGYLTNDVKRNITKVAVMRLGSALEEHMKE